MIRAQHAGTLKKQWDRKWISGEKSPKLIPNEETEKENSRRWVVKLHFGIMPCDIENLSYNAFYYLVSI